MKAVVYEKYAPNDDFKSILKVKDVDEPKPKSNEVVFKVKAAALNYNDIWGMRGQPVPVPLPHISGSDAAGEVIAVGEDVKNCKTLQLYSDFYSKWRQIRETKTDWCGLCCRSQKRGLEQRSQTNCKTIRWY